MKSTWNDCSPGPRNFLPQISQISGYLPKCPNQECWNSKILNKWGTHLCLSIRSSIPMNRRTFRRKLRSGSEGRNRVGIVSTEHLHGDLVSLMTDFKLKSMGGYKKLYSTPESGGLVTGKLRMFVVILKGINAHRHLLRSTVEVRNNARLRTSELRLRSTPCCVAIPRRYYC